MTITMDYRMGIKTNSVINVDRYVANPTSINDTDSTNNISTDTDSTNNISTDTDRLSIHFTTNTVLPAELLLYICRFIDLLTYCNIVRCCKWIHEELKIDRFTRREVFYTNNKIKIYTFIGDHQNVNSPQLTRAYVSRMQSVATERNRFCEQNVISSGILLYKRDKLHGPCMVLEEIGTYRYNIKQGNYRYGNKHGDFTYGDECKNNIIIEYENGIPVVKILCIGELEIPTYITEKVEHIIFEPPLYFGSGKIPCIIQQYHTCSRGNKQYIFAIADGIKVITICQNSVVISEKIYKYYDDSATYRRGWIKISSYKLLEYVGIYTYQTETYNGTTSVVECSGCLGTYIYKFGAICGNYDIDTLCHSIHGSCINGIAADRYNDIADYELSRFGY